MDDNAAARAEKAEEQALLLAQVEGMRWRGLLPGDLPPLNPASALHRILCPHNHTGSMANDDLCVWWCTRCGHSEVSLAPLAPDPRWLPEGKPAWNSAAVREFSLWRFAFVNLGLALSILALVIAIAR